MTGTRVQVRKQDRPASIARAHAEALASLEAGGGRTVTHEINKQAFLAVFASCEGLLRQDLEARIARATANPAAADALSAALLARYREAKRRNRFLRLEDILLGWKVGTGLAGQIDWFGELKAYRDWLAHGRCWMVPGDRRLHPDTVLQAVARVRQAIPAWPDPAS